MNADIWTPILARRRRRASFWSLIWARRTARGALLTLVAAAGLGGCGKPEGPTVAEPLLAVRVAEVETRNVVEVVEAVGTVSARHEVTLLARLPGTVAELPLAEGAPLESGTLLVRIDAPDMAARLARTEAEAQRAVNGANFACERYGEDVSLAARGIVSSVALAQSEERCSSAEAAVEGAQAAVREVRETADRREERAPGRGMLLRRLVEPGQHVMPGMPLVMIADEARELRVKLGSDDLARGIGPGTPIRWQDASGPATGVVREVGPIHQGPGRTSIVRIDLERAPVASLGTGLTVGFVLQEAQGTAVPLTAVRRDADGEAIFLIEAEHAVRKSVRTTVRADGWAIVEPAPAAGSRVAVGSLSRLRDGRPVYAVTAGGVR
jgi:RND family efflux transporter MFP subunit